jgi:ribosomal subunit interface protein
MANFKTNIKATNYELTSEIRKYIDQQISKFEKVLPNDTEEIILDVEVGKATNHHNQGPVYFAEFNMKYKKQFKRAKSTEEDIRTALELAGDEMARQVRKTKERRGDLMRKGSQRIKKWLRRGQ